MNAAYANANERPYSSARAPTSLHVPGFAELYCKKPPGRARCLVEEERFETSLLNCEESDVDRDGGLRELVGIVGS